jgi:probable rRNA maturation factor
VIDINISTDCKLSLSYNSNNINKLSKKVLNSENFTDGNISIVLSNREYLSKLKKDYFNIDVYTDVIAFNLEDKNDCLDGEIYISIDDVIENSNIFSKSFNDEFARILIHGILHLLGYDDKTKIQKDKMSQLENHYLSFLDYNLISIV